MSVLWPIHLTFFGLFRLIISLWSTNCYVRHCEVFSSLLSFFSYVKIFLSALCETRSVWRHALQEMSTMYFTMPRCEHIVLAVWYLECANIIITPVTFHWGIFCITLFQILCSYSSIFYSSWVPQTFYVYVRLPYPEMWHLANWKKNADVSKEYRGSIFHYGVELNRFLRNASSYLPKCIAWHSIIQQFTKSAPKKPYFIFTVAWRLRPVRNIPSFSHSHLLASIFCVFNMREFREITFLCISYMLLFNFLVNIIKYRWEWYT